MATTSSPLPASTPSLSSSPSSSLPSSSSSASIFAMKISNVDHTNNRTKRGYIFQLPIPDLDEKTAYDQRVSNDRKDWRRIYATARTTRGVCLREWEWSAGECIDTSGTEAGDECEYAKRVRSFTYTRADDPLFKGRKMMIRRKRQAIWIEGDFGDEVDNPEYVPQEDMEHPRMLAPLQIIEDEDEDDEDDNEEEDKGEEAEEEDNAECDVTDAEDWEQAVIVMGPECVGIEAGS